MSKDDDGNKKKKQRVTKQQDYAGDKLTLHER